MTSALNLTFKIKQTPENLAKLAHIKAVFATQIQPTVENELKKSEIVHYARVLVIDDLYMQVITEFDGDEIVYAEFFRKSLRDLFFTVFSLAENPLSKEDSEDPDKFAAYTMSLNLPALGTDGRHHDNPKDDKGFFFQAYPGVQVKEIIGAFPPAP